METYKQSLFRGGRAQTAAKIARILELLNDGQWHTPGDLQKNTELDKNQIQKVIAFLEEYQFVTVNETRKEIRLQEAMRKFFTESATS